MSGYANLQEVVSDLQVSCDDVRYGFGTVEEDFGISLSDVQGVFHEKEGITLIANVDYDARAEAIEALHALCERS